MTVYRVSRTKRATDITGEGSRLNGGRWNHKLTPCIYTSENRALAILEYTVNTNIEEIPRRLSLIIFEISDTEIYEVSEKDLPGNWKENPTPSSTKDFGTALLKSLPQPVIKIPSVVVSEEFNLLLNPLHINNKVFKLINIKDFVYDLRIKSS